MKAKGKREKGSRAEREFAQLLRESGLDKNAKRQLLSGGGYLKGDINNALDLSIEVKNQERLNIWKAIEQAEEEARLSNNQPIVVFKRNNSPFYVCLTAWQWIDLMKKAKSPPAIDSETREIKWALNNVRSAINKLLKLLK